MNWLEGIETANTQFRNSIDVNLLPIERQPCPYAVITCMDPRVNLEAIGIPCFGPSGEANSQVRVIRTIGAIHESRSIVIGIHMAGFKEVAVLMHTDCGCCLAHSKVDTIESNMESNLSKRNLKKAQDIVGPPLRENLRPWLHTFEDPGAAVKREVSSIRQSPFVPESIIVHGLVYNLATGLVEVIVNGYAEETKTL